MAERSGLPRVLILTASVGAGHDGAASGIAAELEARGYDPRVENSLRRVGAWAEWLVISAYGAQLRYAPWAYEALYRAIVRVPGVARLSKWIAGFAGSREMRRLIAEHEPVLVVTTYHLASAMLARLRRKGRLPIPAVCVITDLAPHPMWVYPDLDAHLVLHPRSAIAVGAVTRRPAVVVRPPLRAGFFGPSHRAEARRSLGVGDAARVAIVTGGSWGVGALAETVSACTGAGWTVVVVCGRNERLRDELRASAAQGVIVLGFVSDMPALMDAADAAIVNGPGMTCLEAFARRVPVVFHRPIPGHGRDNARYMRDCGVVRFAETTSDLGRELRRLAKDGVPIEVARASRLFDAPASADALEHVVPRVARSRRRVAASVAIVAVVASWAATSSTGVAAAMRVLRRPVVESGRAVPAIGLCIRTGDDPARAGRALESLRAGGDAATFFVSMRDAERSPALLREVDAAGSEVGNGGDRSAFGGSIVAPLARAAVRRGADEIREVTGVTPRYFLPGSGTISVPQALAVGAERPVLGRRGATVYSRHDLEPGDVVVVDLWRPAGEQVLRYVLAEARRRGLRVLSLSDFLAAGGGRELAMPDAGGLRRSAESDGPGDG